LANPAKIEQYSGIKHAGDKHDAFHLAELQRLKILPKAEWLEKLRHLFQVAIQFLVRDAFPILIDYVDHKVVAVQVNSCN
jgi:hypothetical protein